MTRFHMTFYLIAAAFTAMFAAAQAFPAGGDFPFFDAHIHYNRDAWNTVPPERVFEILDEAGVQRMIVSSTPDEGTLRLYAMYPGRVVPFLRLYRTSTDLESWHGDEDLIAYLERETKRVIYRGIGEVHLDAGEAGAAVVERAATIAARVGLLLYVHTDSEGMNALVRRYPGVRFLWAHAGLSSGPGEAEDLLELSPNLWIELSLRGDVAPGGILDPAWRALFVGYPDRFMVGTDTWITPRWSALVENAEFTRGWLKQLPRGVAEMIAHRNGERLFGGTK